MEDSLDAPALIVTAAVAFASTNVDGYALLLGFFSDKRYRAGEVAAGQFLSVAIQLAISAAIVRFGKVTEAPFLGLAGMVPLLAGLTRMVDRRERDGPHLNSGAPAAWQARGRVLRAATVTVVATSGAVDNILVYSSLLVGRTTAAVISVACTFALLTVLLCLCAYATASSRSVLKALHVAAGRVAPFMATAIGLSLLIRFGTLRWIVSLA